MLSAIAFLWTESRTAIQAFLRQSVVSIRAAAAISELAYADLTTLKRPSFFLNEPTISFSNRSMMRLPSTCGFLWLALLAFASPVLSQTFTGSSLSQLSVAVVAAIGP